MLCDVWSCGVILFALVCGYLPFEDENTANLYKKTLRGDYTAPDFISAQASPSREGKKKDCAAPRAERKT